MLDSSLQSRPAGRSRASGDIRSRPASRRAGPGPGLARDSRHRAGKATCGAGTVWRLAIEPRGIRSEAAGASPPAAAAAAAAVPPVHEVCRAWRKARSSPPKHRHTAGTRCCIGGGGGRCEWPWYWEHRGAQGPGEQWAVPNRLAYTACVEATREKRPLSQ